ncbi:unnamed protein product [Bursaphelenchus okinawaensis]|uniref:Zinc metalloproteinase n=1 Tax=Bursaphelenchus okinawaensis TaxID=465554 RepID=A0A811LAB8_9BILA|nr:unnamed protein product [Bursaphelenchus okinawaensis]CAG9119508.1 unnamed protein product [Bursaphelenchus okinawaensis]
MSCFRLIIFALFSFCNVNISIKLENESEDDRNQVRSIMNRLRAQEEGKHPSSTYNKIKSLIKQSQDITADSEDLFEGDIILSLPQAQKLISNVEKKRNKRQILVDPSLKWNKTIPFEIVDEDARGLAEDSITVIEGMTCLTFTKRTDEEDYIRFVHISGCFSAVGKVGGGQPISMGNGCSLGAAVHEVLHALGLWHEQARTDRDKFVNILYQNIQENRKDNFIKRESDESDNDGERYDYGSLMHYGPGSFTVGGDTLEAVDKRYQHTIGQRSDISFKDTKLINMRYCKDVCPTPLPCKYGGYTDPNDCSQCRCPDGLAGTLCEDVKESTFPDCGKGEWAATENPKVLWIPDTRDAGDCIYRIRAPEGLHVKLELQEQQFECYTTCSSYVEVKYLNDKSTTGFRMCCDEAKGYNIASQNNEMIVIVHHEQESKRFQTKLVYYHVDKHIPSGIEDHSQEEKAEQSEEEKPGSSGVETENE